MSYKAAWFHAACFLSFVLFRRFRAEILKKPALYVGVEKLAVFVRLFAESAFKGVIRGNDSAAPVFERKEFFAEVAVKPPYFSLAHQPLAVRRV